MSLLSHSTDIQSLLDYLYGLQRLGIKLGLDHTEKLLESCGNPQKKFRSIHISGTNGKGSTAKCIASILREAGYKTGLYTSPHLIDFNERISINGDLISNSDIASFILKFNEDISSIESTFFETTTAMAFWYFNKKNVDVAVVETGMGGRLDSTNVLLPEVSVITSIGMDHCDILGETLEEIAREKAGIIKNDTPVIVSQQNKDALEVIRKISAAKNAPLMVPDEVYENNIESGGSHFVYRNEHFTVPLIGKHQSENATLAIEATHSFDSGISIDIIKKGLQKVNWRGRMEKVSANPDCYYDVAHNPQSIDVALSTIESLYKNRPIGVMVLKEGKNISHISKSIQSRFRTLIVTSLSGIGLYASTELHSQLSKNGIEAKEISDLQSALKKGKTLIEGNQCLLIFGSHYAAGDVYNAFDFSFGKQEK